MPELSYHPPAAREIAQSVWETDFMRTRECLPWVIKRYPAAAAEVQELLKGPAATVAYVWNCLRIAEEGRAWARAEAAGVLERNEVARRQDTRSKELARSLSAHARVLEGGLRTLGLPGPLLISKALVGATDVELPGIVLEATRDSGSEEIPQFKPVSPYAFLDALSRLQSELAHYEGNAGSLHRYASNGILYAEPMDHRPARVSLSTGMLFAFELFSRLASMDDPPRLVLGLRMPSAGRPLHHVAAAFLGDALGEHLTEKQAADRVKKLIERNPGIGWGGFLDPPLEYLDTPALPRRRLLPLIFSDKRRE
jgi:hypothetical protein